MEASATTVHRRPLGSRAVAARAPARPGPEVGAERARRAHPDPDRLLLDPTDRAVGACVQHIRAEASCSATTGTSRAASTTVGALLFGTIVTSIIALVIGVPVAVAGAVLHQRVVPAPGARPAFDPRRPARRGSVGRATDCGACSSRTEAAPGREWFASTFSFIPWIGGGIPQLYNYFIAGLILAIMILPIVSAISREVIATVPSEDKEAALALGATVGR